jgi:hypothetical protein
MPKYDFTKRDKSKILALTVKYFRIIGGETRRDRIRS